MSTAQARMEAMIRDTWFLERNLVSPGFDAALRRLGAEVPMIEHEYPSGTEAWTWIIPDRWVCREAYVERLNGERVLDAREHPLHCASYSASFEGVVSRDELFAHLQVHPVLRDGIPFGWKYYRTEWGLCCAAEQRERLTDDEYRVVIRTERAPGMLRVGESVAEGSSGLEFVLCAHLCHPCMVNDGLSGAVVGIEVMRALRALPRRRYTYRLLLLPETIGSIAWLSRHAHLFPKIEGGLFLEMLGTDCPHALQHSFASDSELDRLSLAVLRERDPQAWAGPFRRVIANDERQFNAPGVRVPMLSLSRVFHPQTGKWPYPEYHSSQDTADFVSMERMEESLEIVLHLVRRLEENGYPLNLFRGEVFATRYGLFVDFYEDPEGNRRLFDVMHMVDGTRSVFQIAGATGFSFDAVMATLRSLEHHGLIRFLDRPEGGAAIPRRAV